MKLRILLFAVLGCLCLPLRALPPNDAVVVFNEIHYNPARNAQLSEFIEIYNPTGATVDLSNWRLARGVDFVFLAGATIPAGGYVVIAGNPATIDGLYSARPRSEGRRRANRVRTER